jgi:ribosomal protein S18 acetylase RimI-like enzyme
MTGELDGGPTLALIEIARTPRWALPTVFTTQIATGAMRPWLRERDQVVVDRRAPRVGEVVVVVATGRPLVRRVLESDGRRVLVAAELAPAPDGWLPMTSVVGVVRTLARPAGPMMTRALRAGLSVGADLRDAARRLKARRRTMAVDGRREVRLLDPADIADREAFRELRENIYPGLPAAELPDDPRLPVLGAFLNDRLAGHQTLTPTGPHAVRGPLAVATWARGQGLGTLLVREAVARAGVLCSATYFWEHIHVRNVPSIRCFLSAGFSIIDRPQLTTVFQPGRGEYPVLTVARDL